MKSLAPAPAPRYQCSVAKRSLAAKFLCREGGTRDVTRHLLCAATLAHPFARFLCRFME